MFRFTTLFVFFAISINAYSNTKILFLGLDGLGANYLSRDNAPEIYNIMKESAYSLNMQNTLPAWSATNWFSMFSSTATNVHTIKGNIQRFPKNAPPTFLEYARSQNSSFTALSLHSWRNLNDIIGKGSHIKFDLLKNDDVVLEQLLQTIKNDQLADFTFAYFQGVDQAGHNNLWGSKKYFRALKELDNKIGLIVKALKNKKIYNNIYLALSADHGGVKMFKLRSKFEHGGDRKDVRAIPFVIRGPGIRTGEIKEETRIFDIMPTFAFAQGYRKVPESWLGRVIDSAFKDVQVTYPNRILEMAISTTMKIKFQNKRGKNFDVFTPVSISRKRGYFPLGDVIVVGKNESIKKVVMAPLEPGLTAHPIGFEKVLNNRKSALNPYNLTIFNPIGPFGYICPGEVLVPKITTIQPKRTNYICIHHSYLQKVNSKRIWNSWGQMQAKYGFSFWSPIENAKSKFPLRTFFSRRHKRDMGLDRGYQINESKVILSN